MIPSTRGGNRLHSQLPSECDYLESSSLWQLLIDNSHLTHPIRSDQDNRLNIGAHMKEAFHSKATETKPVFRMHEYIV